MDGDYGYCEDPLGETRVVEAMVVLALGLAERAVNQLGYTLLYALSSSGHEQDAIRVFQQNVQDFPQSSNVYDSLGEAYTKVGEKDLAITNYEKSL